MTIEHDSDTIALSNFPVENSTFITDNVTGKQKNRTSFETTFRMSTYLLAWVIAPGDFSYVEAFTDDNPRKPVTKLLSLTIYIVKLIEIFFSL